MISTPYKKETGLLLKELVAHSEGDFIVREAGIASSASSISISTDEQKKDIATAIIICQFGEKDVSSEYLKFYKFRHKSGSILKALQGSIVGKARLELFMEISDMLNSAGGSEGRDYVNLFSEHGVDPSEMLIDLEKIKFDNFKVFKKEYQCNKNYMNFAELNIDNSRGLTDKETLDLVWVIVYQGVLMGEMKASGLEAKNKEFQWDPDGLGYKFFAMTGRFHGRVERVLKNKFWRHTIILFGVLYALSYVL